MTKSQELGPNPSTPQALEAEAAALGCVLIDPDAYHEAVATGLLAGDFFLHKHRWIWDAFKTLAEATPPLPIDIITVSEVLLSYQQLAEAGGAAYLTELMTAVPTSLHVAAYAGLVVKESRRRQLIELATQAAQLAYQTDLDPTAAAASMTAKFSRLAATATVHGGFMQDIVPVHLDHLVQVANHPEDFPVLTTSLPDWDARAQGFFKGDYDVIAAKTGVGKTALMLQIAAANAADCTFTGISKPARHVAYFSLEMDREQILGRLLARHAAIEVSKFRRAGFTSEEWTKLWQIEGPLTAYQLYLDDTAALTLAHFRRVVNKLVQEWGLDLAILDYFQLMRGEGRGENRNQELSEISGGLRQTAKECNIALIIGSQFSRKSDSRADPRPILSDLRDTGSLEQDATGVTFLHPDAKQLDAGVIIGAKQRNGGVFELPYIFDKPFSRFKSAQAFHIDLSQL